MSPGSRPCKGSTLGMGVMLFLVTICRRWRGIPPPPPKCEAVPKRNVKRFRRGLVLEAHRLLYHSTLGVIVIHKKKRSACEELAAYAHVSTGPTFVKRYKDLIAGLNTEATEEEAEGACAWADLLRARHSSGRLTVTVRRHSFKKDSPSSRYPERRPRRCSSRRAEFSLDCLLCALFARQRSLHAKACGSPSPETHFWVPGKKAAQTLFQTSGLGAGQGCFTYGLVTS